MRSLLRLTDEFANIVQIFFKFIESNTRTDRQSIGVDINVIFFKVPQINVNSAFHGSKTWL